MAMKTTLPVSGLGLFWTCFVVLPYSVHTDTLPYQAGKPWCLAMLASRDRLRCAQPLHPPGQLVVPGNWKRSFGEDGAAGVLGRSQRARSFQALMFPPRCTMMAINNSAARALPRYRFAAIVKFELAVAAPLVLCIMGGPRWLCAGSTRALPGPAGRPHWWSQDTSHPSLGTAGVLISEPDTAVRPAYTPRLAGPPRRFPACFDAACGSSASNTTAVASPRLAHPLVSSACNEQKHPLGA